MGMKHTSRILMAALIAAGASAAPQTTARTNSENFDGFSISLGGSQVTQSGSTLLQELYQEITVNANDDTTGGTPPGGSNDPDTYDIRQETSAHSYNNKDAFNGQVALAYNLAITENFLIGIEVAKQFGASTRFETFINASGNTILDETIETAGSWSVALKPCYTVSDKFMVYAKVSRANAKITGNVNLLLADAEGLPVDNLSFDKSVGGLGLGLGFEYNFDAHWFLQGEIERISFNSYKKTQTSGTYNSTLVDNSLVTDGGVQAGEFYRGTADVGVNLSKATISLGYRF